jgi:hypothetical protein
MFSHKIKWTIDREKSEICFKEKYVLLSFENPSVLHCNEKLLQNHSGDKSGSYVGEKEYSKKISYNLVVFEEKRSKQFWKKNTFSAMLILKDYNINLPLTLYKASHNIDSNGVASARFFVHGEINKDELGIETLLLEDNEPIMLSCVLLYGGEITLVQDYTTI